MTDAMNPMLTKLFKGAFWGMIAWQAYGLLEYATLTVLPQLRYHMIIADWHWRFSLELLGYYTGAGIVLGALGGLIFGRNFRAVGSLSVALAVVAHLVTSHSLPVVETAMAVCLIAAFFAEKWNRRFSLLVNPWATAFVLLFASWGTNELLGFRGIAVRLAFAFILLAAVLAASIFIGNLRVPREGRMLRAVASVIVAAAIVFGCAAVLNPGIRAEVGPGTDAQGTAKPNVVLITLDTVRADHLSLYGYRRNTTPKLTELAQSSTVFVHPVSAGNMTLTSHAAILSGAYGSWNGARPHIPGSTTHGLGIPISQDYPTIAQIMARNGYSTGAVVANTGFLIPTFGISRGFQTFDFPSAIQLFTPAKYYCLRFGIREILHRFTSTSKFDPMFLRADEINRRALRFVDKAATQHKPFLLFLNYMDAHDPYTPPAPFNNKFTSLDPSLDERTYHDLAIKMAAFTAKTADHQREIDYYMAQYDGGIAYMDEQIADLLAQFRSRNLFDNTLFVITSDHGEAFGDRNLMGHGLSVYEDEVNVPLVIKYPGVSQKERLDAPASHIDLMPTILDVAGIKPALQPQGRSLRTTPADQIVVVESFPSPVQIKGKPRDYTERGLYSGAWKYIASTAGNYQLYDLSSDPGEMHDLCSAQPARCGAMQTRMDGFTASIPKQSAPGKTKVDQPTLERLKSLGYLGH